MFVILTSGRDLLVESEAKHEGKLERFVSGMAFIHAIKAL
jgi:hypothetical protein